MAAELVLTVWSPKANEVGLSVTAGAPLELVPVPLNAIDCGEPVAESTMLTFDAFAPIEVGLNATEILQLAPAASDVPHVLDNEKLAAWLPVSATEDKVKFAEPVFLRVTVLAAEAVLTVWLPKASDVGFNVTVVAPVVVVPVPLSAIICGEPLALSAMLTLDVFAPAKIGVNETEMLQLAPAASDEPQVFDKEKSCAWLPVNEMAVSVRLVVPVFLRVAVLGAERVLTAWLPNANVVELKVTPGAPVVVLLSIADSGCPLSRFSPVATSA